MEMKPVKSSNIAAVGYDPERHVLRVQFKNASAYEYHGVDAETHQALLHAPSVGTFFHTHVRDHYAHKRLTP